MINNIKYITAGILLSLTFASCDESNIDPISKVDPGQDVSAPTITIASPTADVLIPFTETKTDFNFKFNVTDDIEIGSVEIFLDGTKLKTYDSFLDYRNLSDTYVKKDLGLGNHTFNVVAKDLSGKSTTKSFLFNLDNKYVPLAGEKLFMPVFSGNVFTNLVTGSSPTIVGTPTTSTAGRTGAAYQGATDSYLSFPIAGLFGTSELSVTFWYKVNASPDRSGILVVGNPTALAINSDESRKYGFRLFREGSATLQTIKANVGIGNGESWNDGGAITVANNSWVHIAFTISATETKIYFDGVLKRTATLTSPLNLTGCSDLSIGSGDPTFTYWNHKADSSLYDEVRIFNKALTLSEIQTVMNQ